MLFRSDIVLRLAAGGIESAMSELREAEIGPEGKPDRAWIAGLDLAFRFPPPPANPADLAPSVEVSVALDQFEAPETLTLPLGQTVERVIAELALIGPLPARADRESVDAWRKAGGTFEIRQVAGNWGPLGVDGDGTLALDNDLQMVGAFALRLSGYEEALNALVAAEMVRPTAASAAKIVLNLIAKPDSVSGRAVASVPLTLQEGAVSVGPAILMALPRLTWE